MASVWESTGYAALAARARALAGKLGSGLRRAVHRSARRLKDGSLFVPIRLLDGERPYKKLTASRAGQLLESRDAVRARVGHPAAAQRAGPRRAPVHARARLAHPRPRPRERVHALPRSAVSALRHRPGVRPEHGAVPRRQRPRRAARPQPLRPARRGHDAGDVRLRRGGDRRTGSRRALPQDVPAAELGEQRGVPRDAAAHARARGRRARTAPRAGSSSRSRRRAPGCGPAGDRRPRRADELRQALVHAVRDAGIVHASLEAAAVRGRCRR